MGTSENRSPGSAPTSTDVVEVESGNLARFLTASLQLQCEMTDVGFSRTAPSTLDLHMSEGLAYPPKQTDRRVQNTNECELLPYNYVGSGTVCSIEIITHVSAP